MARKLIIALHGLSNKPPEPIETEWWWKAITDGLHFHRGGSGFPELGERQALLKSEDLVMSYWADILYPYPSDVHSSPEPYVKVSQRPPGYTPKMFDGMRKWITSALTSQWDRFRGALGEFGSERLVNEFLKEAFQDLHAYWSQRVTKRLRYWKDDEWREEERTITDQEMRDEFRRDLVPHLSSQEEVDILVIAHSMGSIIAYDTIVDSDPTLSELDQRPVTLITIGSPLGIPTVQDHLKRVPGERRPTFPGKRLKAWHNFADPGDLIAAVPYLAPQFKDTNGRKRVQDRFVKNDFRDRDGKVNSHKSYGYLRCPELAQVLEEFLRNP